MSPGTSRSDFLSLKRELLESARLDVQPLPSSVRKQALLAATIAVATSTTAGTAGAAATATSATATSAALGTSASVALGLVKLGGIGALLVSVGTATYYGTAGVWHPPRTSSSAKSTPEMRAASRRAPLPGTPTLSGVPSSAVGAGRMPDNNTEGPRAGHAAGMNRSTPVDAGRDIVPVQPKPREGVSTLLEPSPGSTENVPPQTRDALSEELALLDSARARLVAGDSGDTLFLLDEYAHAFPSGALQPEAMFLRIQALSQGGQQGAATQVGRRFLNQYPTSPHADRVRALIESHGEQNP